MLPLIAGLTGDAFYDPAAMTDGFHMAMIATAALAALRRRARLADDRPDVLDTEAEPGGDTPIAARAGLRVCRLRRAAATGPRSRLPPGRRRRRAAAGAGVALQPSGEPAKKKNHTLKTMTAALTEITTTRSIALVPCLARV